MCNQHGTEKGIPARPSPSLLPLVPPSLAHVHALLHATDEKRCRDWEIVGASNSTKEVNLDSDWIFGTSLCLDSLPNPLTPSTCRMHSISFDENDISFELKKGLDGCRVHVWGGRSSELKLNYMTLGPNAYFYPLAISPSSTPGAYSVDDFLGLLGHEDLRIHYLKSTSVVGDGRRVLRSLLASKRETLNRIDQIQILFHLPKITLETWRDMEDYYRDLVGLTYLGFKLAKSTPDRRHQYTISPEGENEELDFSTIYELVWLK